MSGAVGPSADHIGAIQRRDFALTFPKQHASDNAPLVVRPPCPPPVALSRLTLPLLPALPARQVLCGWVGCQDRFLRKYSELLNEAGYPTVRSICPKSAIFWPFEGRRRAWAADLLRFVDLASGAGSERPLVLYAFSNGGAFVAEQVDALVGGTAAPFAHLRPRLAGVAFDSAPAYLLPSSGARALGEGQPAVARAALALLFYLIMAVTLVVDPRRARNYWCAGPSGSHNARLPGTTAVPMLGRPARARAPVPRRTHSGRAGPP